MFSTRLRTQLRFAKLPEPCSSLRLVSNSNQAPRHLMEGPVLLVDSLPSQQDQFSVTRTAAEESPCSSTTSGITTPSAAVTLDHHWTTTSDAFEQSPAISELLARVINKDVHDIQSLGSVSNFVLERIQAGETHSFLVTNLAPILEQFQQWRRELPMVEPFYAVKCNPDPAIVRLLAWLGCSFDCATMSEIEMVLHGLGDDLSLSRRGRAASSVVYANPAKMQHMLEFAIDKGVRMTVFDGEDELLKIKSLKGGDKMQLLLRLTTDDKASICRFSKKFGCPVTEAPHLLRVAHSLGLNVAGVSFHVGSGCGDSGAYTTALEHARSVFEEGARLGMAPMTIVDIGGGFPGDAGGYGGPGMPTFQHLAAAIREGIRAFGDMLAESNRSLSEIRFIAEPGRYFVSASTAIATEIYSRKGGQSAYQALYVCDGVYGSFNNVVYDHATPVPYRLNSLSSTEPAAHGDDEVMLPSAVFGPTCDGLDQMCSLDSTKLPRCEVGEWLFWPNMGAYTHTASFVFNGYTHLPKKTYCFLKPSSQQ